MSIIILKITVDDSFVNSNNISESSNFFIMLISIEFCSVYNSNINDKVSEPNVVTNNVI